MVFRARKGTGVPFLVSFCEMRVNTRVAIHKLGIFCPIPRLCIGTRVFTLV